MKRLAIAALALALVPQGAAFAQTSTVAQISAADDAQIAALAGDFFAMLRVSGMEAAMRDTFGDNGDVLSPNNVAIFRTIDENCAPMSEVELIGIEDFGTRAARRNFVTLHGDCLIRWEIMFARYDVEWVFQGFNFATLDGNNW